MYQLCDLHTGLLDALLMVLLHFLVVVGHFRGQLEGVCVELAVVDEGGNDGSTALLGPALGEEYFLRVGLKSTSV